MHLLVVNRHALSLSLSYTATSIRQASSVQFYVHVIHTRPLDTHTHTHTHIQKQLFWVCANHRPFILSHRPSFIHLTLSKLHFKANSSISCTKIEVTGKVIQSNFTRALGFFWKRENTLLLNKQVRKGKKGKRKKQSKPLTLYWRVVVVMLPESSIAHPLSSPLHVICCWCGCLCVLLL